MKWKCITFFSWYRIYLTDLTPDNIVVDAHTLRSSFVDLDNSLIVDSLTEVDASTSPPPNWHQIHRHEQIECNGCFAYVPEEICLHHLSDLNLFSVCQVGFLLPIIMQISYIQFLVLSFTLCARAAVIGRFEWESKPRLIAFDTTSRWRRIVVSVRRMFLL